MQGCQSQVPIRANAIAIVNLAELVRLDPLTGAETFIANTDVQDLRPLVFERGTGAVLSAGKFGDELYELDVSNGTTALRGRVTIAGDSITGFNGLATEAETGTLYAVVQLRDNANRKTRNLVTIDPSTLTATNLGTLSENGVASIAFLPDGELLAVTGDGADNPETLWSVDTGSASLSLIAILGAGDDGEAIAGVPARLTGTLRVATVGGVATFSDLQIDAPGIGYTLAANSAAGLAADTSAAFDITP